MMCPTVYSNKSIVILSIYDSLYLTHIVVVLLHVPHGLIPFRALIRFSGEILSGRKKKSRKKQQLLNVALSNRQNTIDKWSLTASVPKSGEGK